MTKTFKKIISITIALAMVVITPVMAFARDWYLEDGDILIEADENGQYVTQGSVTEADDAPVITNNPDGDGYSEGNNITVKTEGDAVAEFTIKDLEMYLGAEYRDDTDEVYITDDAGKSAIDIGDSKAEITVEGENYIHHYDGASEVSKATIHVSEGELTIDGNGTLTIEADSFGAKIGSDEEEEMSGTIHITGNVTITAEENGTYDGAAIGSGEYGDFTGKIIIDGEAEVTAVSNDRGAGIGAGEDGDFRGDVVIGGEAYVYAEGTDDSAGIGSGEDGSFSGGSITIKDNARVEAIGSREGPGIGAADDTPLDGDIIIKDYAVVFVRGGIDPSDFDEDTAPDIGSEGGMGEDKGSISILGEAQIYKAPMSEEENYIIEPIIIGSKDPNESEEYHPFGGRITIGPDTLFAEMVRGAELLENMSGWTEYVRINKKGEETEEHRDVIEVHIDSPEQEEENPNTGAPVIVNSYDIIFISVAVTARKRED